MKEVWSKVKNFELLKSYLIDLKDNEYLGRQFMWDMLSTLKSKTTKTLVEDAIKNKGVGSKKDKESLIKIAPKYH